MKMNLTKSHTDLGTESVGMTLEDIFPSKSTKPTPPPTRLVKEGVIPKKPRE